MLRVKYSKESSNYFLDNGDLVFELRVTIESLVFSGGIPEVGIYTAMPGGMFVWELMDHTVIYDIQENRLTVWSVIPD